MIYTFLLSLHLLAVISFVGYIFFDVFIYASAYKKCEKLECDRVKQGFTKTGGLYLGFSFLIIVISGYFMLAAYDIRSFKELFSSLFGILLFIKLLLIILMLFLTAFSIIFIRVLKRGDPFKGKSHIYALILSIFTVFLAVFMTRI